MPPSGLELFHNLLIYRDFPNFDKACTVCLYRVAGIQGDLPPQIFQIGEFFKLVCPKGYHAVPVRPT